MPGSPAGPVVQADVADLALYGAPWDPDTRRCKRILGEARVEYEWVDVDGDPEAEAHVRRRNEGRLPMPFAELADGTVLVAPTPAELAARLGIEGAGGRHSFDLIIAGAGPTGLTAALYAVREGISCLVLERAEPGGQAASVPHVQGCPGFSDGTPGEEVEASIVAQAHRYGVRILRGDGLAELARVGSYLVAVTDAGEEYTARAVLVATGATYGELNVPGEEELLGAGVHRCASCEGPYYRKSEELLVVGNGDLALQEALYLTQFAGKVRVLMATASPAAAPALLDRTRRHPKLELHPNTEVVELVVGPEGGLASVQARDVTTGFAFAFTPAAVFVYAGMDPHTDGFLSDLELDGDGFVLTDGALETSVPGVFAAGDVRAGATPQLAAALAEGATSAVLIRRYLEQTGDLAGRPSGGPTG